jgi:hypothetical protein
VDDDELEEDELEEVERERDHRALKYILVAVGCLAFASAPNSRFHDVLRIATWTVAFVGLVLNIAWPFLVDRIARGVVLLIVAAHAGIVMAAHPYLLGHNYMLIFAMILAEIVMSILPLAWLDARSLETRKANFRGSQQLSDRNVPRFD